MVIDHSNDHQYPERFPKYEYGPFRFALPNSVLFVRGAVLARGNDPCSPIGKVPGLTSKNLLKLNYYKQANLNWKGGWV